MDNIERDFTYDQKIEDITDKLELLILKDITDKLELLILKAISHVLDNLMQAYWCDENNDNNKDEPWPF
jgi:hypothetical protein